MILVPWSRRRPLVWDETCRGRNMQLLDMATYIFLPFGVETIGPWSPSARILITELSRHLID